MIWQVGFYFTRKVSGKSICSRTQFLLTNWLPIFRPNHKPNRIYIIDRHSVSILLCVIISNADAAASSYKYQITKPSHKPLRCRRTTERTQILTVKIYTSYHSSVFFLCGYWPSDQSRNPNTNTQQEQIKAKWFNQHSPNGGKGYGGE